MATLQGAAGSCRGPLDSGDYGTHCLGFHSRQHSWGWTQGEGPAQGPVRDEPVGRAKEAAPGKRVRRVSRIKSRSWWGPQSSMSWANSWAWQPQASVTYWLHRRALVTLCLEIWMTRERRCMWRHFCSYSHEMWSMTISFLLCVKEIDFFLHNGFWLLNSPSQIFCLFSVSDSCPTWWSTNGCTLS